MPFSRNSTPGDLLSAFSRVDGQPKAAKLAERLHALRVQTKRLNALLELLRANLTKRDRERTRRKLKEIRKRFSNARDRQVMEEVLTGTSTKLPRSAHKEVSGWIRGAFGGVSLAPSSREILRTEDQLAAVLRARTLKPVTDAELQGLCINGLRRLYKEARQGGHRARKKRRMKDFHESRRQTKNLKLGMEICQVARIKIADDLLQQFAEVEQALGRFRDLSMALEFAREENAPRVLKREVKRRRRKVLRNALRSSKKLFALSPSTFMRKALGKDRAH